MVERIKKITDKTSFFNMLSKYSYKQYCTFLSYPLYDNYNDPDKIDFKNTKCYKNKKIKEIKKKVAISGKCTSNFKINNNVLFLGLNAATRYKEINNNNDFQMMHDVSNASNDYKIAQLLYDYDHQNHQKDYQLSGSFAFDLLNNIITTNMFNISSLVNKLDKNKKNISAIIKNNNYYVDLKKCPRISFAQIEYIHDKIALKKDKLNITYEKLYSNSSNKTALKNKILNLNSKIAFLEKCEKTKKAKLLEVIYNHIIEYDLPYFNSLMRTLSYNDNKSKVVVCFGSKSKRLADEFNDLCKLNLNIVRITHYSASLKRTDRLKELNSKL